MCMCNVWLQSVPAFHFYKNGQVINKVRPTLPIPSQCLAKKHTKDPFFP